MTVGRLISFLGLFDPDEPVVFQLLLAEHTDYSVEEFGVIADYLEGSDSFGEETVMVFRQWCVEALDCVEQDGKGI